MNSLVSKHFLATLYMGFILLLISGCKQGKVITKTELPPPPPIDNLAEIKDRLNTLEPQFKWLRMRSTIDYESPDNNYTLNASFRMQKNELLWASVNLMIEVARAQVTRDSAVLLNRMEKSYMTLKQSDLYNLVGIDGLDLNALQKLLMAHPPFGVKSETKLDKHEGGKYFLSNTSNLFKEEIELDESNLKMTSYSFKKNASQNVTVTYEDFKQVESLLLPQKIVFNIASPEKITLTLNVTDYILLDADDAPFSIPATYKKAE